MDITTLLGGFWSNLFSLLIALLGLGFAIWSYFKSKQRKLITYEFEDKNTNVVSIDRDKGEQIEIFLDGKQVEEVRFQLIKIRNEGNVAIDHDDYKQPLRIAFVPQSVSKTSQSSEVILRAGIPEAAPPLNISSQNAKDYIILDAENQYVALKDVLLNASDWIKIKVLTLGKVDILVKGQIKDGQIKPYIPAQNFFTWRKVLISTLLGALLFFLLYNSLGLLTTIFQGTCAFGSVKMEGSSAFYASATRYAKNYAAACPIGIVSIDQTASSSVALFDLKNGSIQIADSEMPSSVVLPNLDPANFEDHQIAVIVFTVVINKSVTGVSSLSRDQLLKIYDGTFQNWKQVAQNAPDLPIKVFGRPTNSGTYTAFTRHVLGTAAFSKAPSYKEADRTDLMALAVVQTPGAIGYVDEGTAGRLSSSLTSIEIDQESPTQALVENNAYPFWTIEHFYARKNPDKLVTSFITYVSNNTQTNDTFIKLQDMPAKILQTRA